MSSAANSYDALKNHLLAALPADEFLRVQSKLEPLSFKLGEFSVNPAVKWIMSISRRRQLFQCFASQLNYVQTCIIENYAKSFSCHPDLQLRTFYC